YKQEVGQSRGYLQQLRDLTADNPDQQRRIPTLERILGSWIAQSQQIVDRYNSEGAEAARQLLLAHAKPDTQGTLSGLVDDSIAAEQELLARRQARAARDEARTSEAAYISGALGLILLAAGVWLTFTAYRNYRAVLQERWRSEQRLNE